MCKVSVIIPVYNTESFVKETLMCIVEQTLEDIEIIVIDDGSTDNSLLVIREVADIDSRIMVIVQNNSGQAHARNVGLDNASGEFVYFMDSDDLLKKEALEICYNKLKSSNSELVFFDSDIFGDNKSIDKDYYYYTHLLESRKYTGCEVLSYLIDRHKYRVPVWLYMMRREFLYSINLKFHTGIIHEDEAFTMLLYAQAENITPVKLPLYLHRVREGSTMTSVFSWRNIDGYLISFNDIKDFIRQNSDTCGIIETYIIRMINAAIRHAYKMSLKDRVKLLYIIFTKGYAGHVNSKTFLVLLFKGIIR